jgi:hypothetical protein
MATSDPTLISTNLMDVTISRCGLNLVIAAIVFWNSTYIALWPTCAQQHNRRPMRGSPIYHRSAGSTSASPAISCGIAPPRPRISAGRLNLGRTLVAA